MRTDNPRPKIHEQVKSPSDIAFRKHFSDHMLLYRKSSNYSAKKFNSNLQLALVLEPKNTSKVASGA